MNLFQIKDAFQQYKTGKNKNFQEHRDEYFEYLLSLAVEQYELLDKIRDFLKEE